MTSVVSKLSWGFLLLFFLPTLVVVASWNSLPGDALFGAKLALEQTLLFAASPLTPTVGTLHVKYTERRLADAKRLISDKQSIQGLPYLVRQIEQTKAAIDRSPNPEVKTELAQTYIATLANVLVQLEEQKQVVYARQAEVYENLTRLPEKQEPPATPQSPTQAIIKEARPPASNVSRSGTPPVHQASLVVERISETQKTIRKTIDELAHARGETNREFGEAKKEGEESSREKKEERRGEESEKRLERSEEQNREQREESTSSTKNQGESATDD